MLECLARHARHAGVLDRALPPVPKDVRRRDVRKRCQVTQEHNFPFQAGAWAQSVWALHLEDDPVVDPISARLAAAFVYGRDRIGVWGKWADQPQPAVSASTGSGASGCR